MISESGVYALMIHHHIPENQSLRQWLTHEVVPALRNVRTNIADQGSSLSSLHWMGHSLSLLHWQKESWIKWRDMPGLIQPTKRMPV